MNYAEFYGNKFLFVDTNETEINTETNLPRLSFDRELQESLIESCEVDLTMYYKHTGTFDGIANYKCTFTNKDGSEASLCGNALLRLMEQEGFGEYLFKTISGEYFGRNNENELAIRMQKAKIQESNMPDFIFNVNVGNSHRIMLFKEDRAQYNFAYGSMVYGDESCENIEHNEHIVWQEDANTFQVRCFERGVGETQACGSGAYAVGVAMIKHFNLNEVKIIMKGGKYIVKDGFLIVKK